MRAIAIAAALLVAGCATTNKTYVQATGEDAAAQQALGMCQAKAELEFPDRGIIPSPGTINSRSAFTDACMRSLGYVSK